jgi:bifunctional DNA-binding transcriptional regulator/antitoxin component of YhaV-PrlF toxin-antitoxin module
MGTRVTIKGQVTIPRDIRLAAGIDAGTELDWHYDPVTRIIAAERHDTRPAPTQSHFARFRGIARGSMTTDEILELTRGPQEE